MDIEGSLKELTENLESRKSVIRRLEETCRDLESKIQTLKAAQIVLESRERSKGYQGMTFKEIVMSELDRWGTSIEKFIDEYADNPRVIEEVARCMMSGDPPSNEDLHFDIAKKASDLFELDFMVLLESLKVKPVETPEVDDKPKYLIPQDFGGMLKFYLAKYHMSQRELSEHLGVNAINVSNWATNKCLPKSENCLYRLSVLFKNDERSWKEASKVTKSIKSKNKGAGV